MKTTKKLLALLLATTFVGSLTSLAACGPNSNSSGNLPSVKVEDWKDESVSGKLGIRVWKGGYGTAWLDNVAAGFMQHYPNVEVNVAPSEERSQVMSETTSGVATKYDVFFSEAILTQYTQHLIDLADVYNYQWEGEEKKIVDKIDPAYIDAFTVGGVKSLLPAFTGTYGLTYNTQWIEEFPVTTDGLIDLCDDLKADGVTPIVFGQTDYWNYAYSSWFAQYEGLTTYKNAQVGRNAEGKIDPTVSYLDGGLKAMQVVEDLLWYENGRIATDSTGLQFIIAQREFLKEEKAAMMCMGSWMINEMSRHLDGSYDFKMAKFPVISSIVDKCTTIADDAELTALVKAIDAGATTLTGDGYEVNQADFDKVAEARGFIYVGGEAANACIPKVSKNQELAKLFLKYMYSDEGIMLHAKAQCGNTLPVLGYDFMDELGEMDAKKKTFLETSYKIMFNSNKFFNLYYPGVSPYYQTEGMLFENIFGSKNAADRTRATQLFTNRKNLWSNNNHAKYYLQMQMAGLSTED